MYELSEGELGQLRFRDRAGLLLSTYTDPINDDLVTDADVEVIASSFFAVNGADGFNPSFTREYMRRVGLHHWPMRLTIEGPNTPVTRSIVHVGYASNFDQVISNAKFMDSLFKEHKNPQVLILSAEVLLHGDLLEDPYPGTLPYWHRI